MKAGKDFELHIPYKATPKAQAQVLIDDKELMNDDRVNVKVRAHRSVMGRVSSRFILGP